jgi:cyclohexyl-isocyanide hydratase
MRAAFVIFDRMTALDFVGVYDCLGRLKTLGLLPDFEWTVSALNAPVTDDRGLRFLPDVVGQSLSGFDLVVVPGGHGTRALAHDASFIDWIRSSRDVPLKASVCTGALLLGAAGFLADKPATTHPSAFKELEPYCREVRPERVVDAGDVVTARGVSSAIDLGLHLVQRLAGPEAKRRVSMQIDYPWPDGPHNQTVQWSDPPKRSV